MFNIRRLADTLSSLGFFVSFETKTEARFVRANVRQHLFEEVGVHAGKQRGGKWGDIANAGISIALTPGPFTSPKGMAEAECLSDWSPTNSKEQAFAWERQVVDATPARLETLVRTHGPELLARTADARAAVEKYLSLLGCRLSTEEIIETLSDGATESELQEARRLARTEGFIGLPKRDCYDLISLLITRHAGQVESDPRKFFGKSPNAVPELNWRFQLLASRLYPERGWEQFETRVRHST